MKLSKFNIFTKYEPDGVYIGYNCMSNGTYVFNKKQFEIVNQLSKNPDMKGDGANIIREKLIKGRFLVNDDVDEIKLLKLRNNMARYNPNGLGMVITPTLICNFNCPYCYVDRKKVSMDRHTISRIKNFFRKKSKNCDTIQVCWTGGEPLLALEIVEELNSYFLDECRKKRKKYICSMITNGSLLKPQIFDRLKKCGIGALQITLDGYKEYHDRTRFTLGGQKTYSAILDNVIRASNNNFQVVLRNNIDKCNYESTYRLLDDLAESGINKDNVYFAPCRVMDPHIKNDKCSGTCFRNREFSLLEPEIVLYSLKKGFKISKEILSTRHTFCGANTLTLFVIDSCANILKCWCNLGNMEKNKVGYIRADGEAVITDHNVLAQWMAWDPLTIEECLNCKVLPICMGGCMYYNIMGETDTIDIGCSTIRHNLEETLLLYYLSVTKTPAELEKINLLKIKLAA